MNHGRRADLYAENRGPGITDAGLTFLEISGEILDPDQVKRVKKESTAAREAFFLDFAEAIRKEFPDLPLLVMGAQLSKALDMVGLAQPAVFDASAPSSTLLNMSKGDDEARAIAISIPTLWLLKKIGNYIIGAGYDTVCRLVPHVVETDQRI
ncbi:uncharacterized protein FPRO_00065 [Fusarium proliferatum ET1]|uniref:Related to NADH oxidase n=1 Tax=Fusarium proliferatum (strain ET1) TaxID=1227346 RepID=A0A1L7V6K9_FUSPR|nr:uncharacterized protein FPRO_00065 [Fusarium proliferatum ET1]CZR35812.1 related to NADH oxidase [Fusarium proliferatum ET1]